MVVSHNSGREVVEYAAESVYGAVVLVFLRGDASLKRRGTSGGVEWWVCGMSKPVGIPVTCLVDKA